MFVALSILLILFWSAWCHEDVWGFLQRSEVILLTCTLNMEAGYVSEVETTLKHPQSTKPQTEYTF
jgi:hypothetical protein